MYDEDWIEGITVNTVENPEKSSRWFSVWIRAIEFERDRMFLVKLMIELHQAP